MSKDHEKQTISDLIAKVLAIGPVDGYRTHKEWVGGKLTFTAEPLEPFVVDEDGVVHMKTAEIDYESINKGVGELMQFLDSRIGTLRNDVLALSDKVDGEYTSTTRQAEELDWKRTFLHVKIDDDGTDADVGASRWLDDDLIIPLGKATNIIRSLKSLLKEDEPTEVPLFDPRKDIGETFSKACKNWTESIAEATGPRSDLAKTIEHLTVHLDPEELYDDLVKSPEFKSVMLNALCRSPRTVHIKL